MTEPISLMGASVSLMTERMGIGRRFSSRIASRGTMGAAGRIFLSVALAAGIVIAPCSARAGGSADDDSVDRHLVWGPFGLVVTPSLRGGTPLAASIGASLLVVPRSHYCGAPTGFVVQPEVGVLGAKVDIGAATVDNLKLGSCPTDGCGWFFFPYAGAGLAGSWLHRWGNFQGVLDSNSDYLGGTLELTFLWVNFELGVYRRLAGSETLVALTGGIGF